MFNKSVIVAIAALRVASSTSDQYIRNLGSILFALVQRFYEARMEEAQMRLAPLSRPPKNPSNCGAPFRIRFADPEKRGAIPCVPSLMSSKRLRKRPKPVMRSWRLRQGRRSGRYLPFHSASPLFTYRAASFRFGSLAAATASSIWCPLYPQKLPRHSPTGASAKGR
jgi:hypothetical protein